MYESFYGLRERPFSLLPDPDYLYLSPKHLRALTLLEYGMMNQAGFSVICGDTGAGKTTLIRRLLSELGEDTTVGLITNTHKSFGELLSWVLMAFGLDGDGMSKAHMHQLLIEFLIDQYAQNRHTVLIVDEAQNMTADTLEELRMLSNINSDKDQVLQVILAGQPALRETLRRPELMQFAQRIAVDYYLESLNRDETREYIQHRLEVAGGDTNTFTEDACHAVYRYSGGTPRLINLLCDTALVYGFAEQTHIIEAQLVEDVVREQHRNSIVPTFNKPLDIPEAEVSEPQNKHRRTADRVEKRAKKSVADAPKVQATEVHLLNEQQTVASMNQNAMPDYEIRQSVGHSDVQNTSTISESVPVTSSSTSTKSTPHYEEPSLSSKVTRIKKSSLKNSPSDDITEDETQATSHTSSKAHATSEDHPSPAIPHHNAHKPDTSQRVELDEQTELSMEDTFDQENYQADSSEHSAYKDVYPIVHVAEPKRNFNVLILGFAGGMALTSIFMFIAAWMMFRSETPVAPTPVTSAVVAAPQTDSTPTISAEDKAHLETIQRERDDAMAASETLKRERDAALASAQKQEAIHAAEKRANEIISAQERKYAGEMERIRKRAFDAEVAAAKARERELTANEEAERVRLEAIHNNTAATTSSTIQAAPVVVPPPPAASTPPPQPDKPATTKASSDTPTQFSANPCNSPSAKFLSTCKR